MRLYPFFKKKNVYYGPIIRRQFFLLASHHLDLMVSLAFRCQNSINLICTYCTYNIILSYWYYELIHTGLWHVTSVIDVDLQINNIRLFLEKVSSILDLSRSLYSITLLFICTLIYILLCYHKNGKQTLIRKIESKKQLQAIIPQQKYLMGWSFNWPYSIWLSRPHLICI